MITQLPTATETEVAPLPNSTALGLRPMAVEPLDPAKAKTPGEFFRAVRSQSACARLDKQGRIQICGACGGCLDYVRVLRDHPVNENVGRDEKSHEVEAEFGDAEGFEDGDEVAISAATTRLLNRQEYLRFHAEYWSEIQQGEPHE